MTKLTFRNSRGSLVDIPAVAATEVRNEFLAILDKACHGGAVAITSHNTTKAVLLSYDEFVSLVKARSHPLDDLGAEFDALMVRLQTPKARRGSKAAFNASSEELGRAAVNSARKRR